MFNDTMRNQPLDVLVKELQDQRDRARDVVVPASKVEAVGSDLLLREVGDAVLSAEGVTNPDEQFNLSPIAADGLCQSLGIPTPYGRKLHASRPDLFMSNVNGWLHGGPDIDPDMRKFLVRTMKHRDDSPGRYTGTEGYVRAWLSDKYRPIDNLDVALAALDGMAQSNVDTSKLLISSDLTESRMYVRVTMPEIEVAARDLLRNYRAPNGQRGDQRPGIIAGLVLTNSEVGKGAFNVIPRMVVQVCTNGLVGTKEALRRVHLGTRLDEGVVEWSQETIAANLRLITSQTRDAVATFLSKDYVLRKVDELTAVSGVPVQKPEQVQHVTKTVGFTKEQGESILNAFYAGSDLTSGGVMQAVTAAAQTYDADTQYEMELQGVRAMYVAAGRNS